MRVSTLLSTWKSFLIVEITDFTVREDLLTMAGTKEGGRKAAQKNLTRDPDFYAKIGRKGGQNGRTGGFAANPELARIAGARGGRISRRRKAEA